MSRRLFALFVWFAACVSPTASAAVVIGGTRIVFPSARHDVMVRVDNKGTEPALVQAWIDTGDERSTPETSTAPFSISPPIFRIDPAHGHALRIVHVGSSVPTDKESLYWLNVLEVPPKSRDAAGTNTLQFAFRHRLKIFHRPADLPYGPERAPSLLTWSIHRNGGDRRLKVVNPSPYFVSFNDVAWQARNGSTVSVGSGMVAPGDASTFTIPPTARIDEAGTVAFVTINDHGATVSSTAELGL